MKDLDKKRQKEMESMRLILDIYEKGHPEEREEIEAIRKYSMERIQKCPKMATKTYCSNCEIHCYRAEFREKVRKIMRYAGPRLLLKKPSFVIDHALKRILYQLKKRT